MRPTRVVLAVTLVAMLLVLPAGGWAKTKTVLGSVTITKVGAPALTTELVGFAVIANPGLEKAITQQLPPFTLPVFVDGDQDDSGGTGKKPFLNRRFDTTLVLTNTSGAELVIRITLREADGDPLGTAETRTIPPNGTIMVLLSDLVN